MPRFLENVGWGLSWGFTYGLIYAGIGLLIGLVTGGAAFRQLGLTTWSGCLLYLGAGTWVGFVAGALRPCTRSLAGTLLTGFLAAVAPSIAMMITLRPNHPHIIALGVLFAALAGPLAAWRLRTS